MELIPKAPYINSMQIDIKRPICCNDGCNKPVHLINYSSTGLPTYRPYCGKCHNAVGGRGVYAEGVIPIKKVYCQNKDGRLGFDCPTGGVELDSCMLDLDHIDGNHYNNIKENIQTICKCCHAKKTKLNGDTRFR